MSHSKKMEFRTEIKLPKSDLQLSHDDSIFLQGSCFSENIGELFHNHKFNTLINPLGIAYNPISIHNLFFKFNRLNWERNAQEVYFNYNFHSDLNGLSTESCNDRYHRLIEKSSSFLKESSTLFITYGTAWVYELISNEQIVNNCHKQSSQLFKKRLLEVKEIVHSFEEMIKRLENEYQKKFNLVLTVSPVRHLKNGFHENQLSKSILLLAVKEICQKFSNCYYFPSYELVLDDLRDYRFFKKDRIHPNELAIEYIWEKLTSTYFSSETVALNEQIAKLQRSIAHKPFQENSEHHQSFIRKLIEELECIQNEKGINFSEEISSLRSNNRNSALL